MSDPTEGARITLRIGRTREGERMSTLIIRCFRGSGKETGRGSFGHGWIVTESSFACSPSSWSTTRARTVYAPGATY